MIHKLNKERVTVQHKEYNPHFERRSFQGHFLNITLEEMEQFELGGGSGGFKRQLESVS